MRKYACVRACVCVNVCKCKDTLECLLAVNIYFKPIIIPSSIITVNEWWKAIDTCVKQLTVMRSHSTNNYKIELCFQ